MKKIKTWVWAIVSAIALVACLAAPRYFNLSWYWTVLFFVLAILTGVYQVRATDESERERALTHMAKRESLTNDEFGKQYFSAEQSKVASKIREIMSRHISIDLARMRPEDLIVEDLRMDALDSMSTVDLVMDIEKEFGIDISNSAAEKMRTLKDIVDYISIAGPKLDWTE
ncbi:MAG: acyl carrier protein [Verrucomicrobiota bacterium]